MPARIPAAVAVALALTLPVLLTACDPPPPGGDETGSASATPTPGASGTRTPSPTPSASASAEAAPAAPTIPDTPVVLSFTGNARHTASGATLSFTYVAHEPQTVGSPEYQQIIDTLVASGDRSLLVDQAWRASNAQYLMVIDLATTPTGGAWPENDPFSVFLGALIGPEGHTSLGIPVSSLDGRFGHGDYVPIGLAGQVIVAQNGGPDGRWDSMPTAFGVRGDTSPSAAVQLSDCTYTPTALAAGLEAQPGWFVGYCAADFGGE